MNAKKSFQTFVKNYHLRITNIQIKRGERYSYIRTNWYFVDNFF
jgi:hypothetical protein